MSNEYYGVATTPMDDYLAHYGVRGMKWGVRKAVRSGDSRRLDRTYAKAAKKLAKLEKRAAKSKSYAKRAAVYGTGAALLGGAAAAGTGRVGRAMENVGEFARNSRNKKIRSIGNAISVAGTGINRWGQSTSLSKGARKFLDSDAVQNLGRSYHGVGGQLVRGAGSSAGKAATAASKSLNGVSNSTLARIGAGAVGVGLGAAAAKNAYRAATAQKKAAKFRTEMNKAFAGTKYANGGSSTSSGTSKKRRKGSRA